jgi:hypothetical protein
LAFWLRTIGLGPKIDLEPKTIGLKLKTFVLKAGTIGLRPKTFVLKAGIIGLGPKIVGLGPKQVS